MCASGVKALQKRMPTSEAYFLANNVSTATAITVPEAELCTGTSDTTLLAFVKGGALHGHR